MAPSAHYPNDVEKKFVKHWQNATESNNFALHGFRRFKTAHLFNLRCIEDEIADLDHTIYQAGLTLDLDPSSSDRLGLRHAKRDTEVPKISQAITQETLLKLRSLLKEYDDALIAFSHIMAMETCSLLDDEKSSSMRTDLNLYEKFNTRLLRTDLGVRTRTDPFQRQLHKYLRAFRYWRLSRNHQEIPEPPRSNQTHVRWSYQNTIAIAEVLGRVATVVIIGVFIIVPLATLSHQSKDIQIIISSLFVVVFAFIITIMLKVSNLEMMVVTAAYAAVLGTFVSNA